MKITQNLEQNYVELMFTRAEHPINIERLATMCYEHLDTLHYKKSASIADCAKVLRDVVNLLPITNTRELTKCMLDAKMNPAILSGFISNDSFPSSSEIIERVCNTSKRDSISYFCFHLRDLIQEISVPILAVPKGYENLPAYGIRGTPGFINIDHSLFKRMGHLMNLCIDCTTAHEKGHGLRFFASKSDVTINISSCLDENAVHTLKSDTTFIKNSIYSSNLADWQKKSSYANFFEHQIYQYYFAPHEILERMAQLKNYFGFTSPDDEFTIEHLNFARAYYVRDFGFFGEIQMYPFLSAITRRTEKKFVSLMNELPI